MRRERVVHGRGEWEKVGWFPARMWVEDLRVGGWWAPDWRVGEKRMGRARLMSSSVGLESGQRWVKTKEDGGSVGQDWGREKGRRFATLQRGELYRASLGHLS